MTELSFKHHSQFPHPAETTATPEDELIQRLEGYDPNCLEAEHLRPRQSHVVQEFTSNTARMLRGEQPQERMAIIHPTGSGKTTVYSELIRVVSGNESPHNTLVLVPNLRIFNQTAGTDNYAGEIQKRAPGISIGKYAGKSRETNGQVTVMTYQMLEGAIKNGHIKKINPKLVICDEMQHIIDGKWAESLKAITEDEGTICVGGTSTAGYSDSRDARDLFTLVLDEMSIREGIKEGILSSIRGYTYKGDSRIKARYGADEFSDQDLIEALLNSKDNYLAAAICAREVELGKKGIVACVPGYDRLHAKVMAKILSKMEVKTPNGTRKIIAAHIDGSMHPDEIDETLREYSKSGEGIDVITYVGLLSEGWDSPNTDFGVWLRPTASKVMAAQRLGRLLRKRPGKDASVHEIVYEITGSTGLSIVTHEDVLKADFMVRKNKGPNTNIVQKPKPVSGKSAEAPKLTDIGDFEINSELAKEFRTADALATSETRLSGSEELAPYQWPTLFHLSSTFGIDTQECLDIIGQSNTATKQTSFQGTTRTFYSPESYATIADRIGIPIGLPEDHTSVAEAVEHCRFVLSKAVDSDDVAKHFDKIGVPPIKYLAEDTLLTAYPQNSLDKLGDIDANSRRSWARRQHKDLTTPHIDGLTWLKSILIDPRETKNPQHKRYVALAQVCLIRAIDNAPPVTLEQDKIIAQQLEDSGAEIPEQVRAVLAAKKISLPRIIVAAMHAKKMLKNAQTSQ